jgi:exodeoxyribonuclease VII small subunit
MKSFEERLERLEEISDEMQKGNIPLEEAVDLFEEGIKLSKGLEKELGKIERRIEILVNKPDKADDKPEMELFADLDEDKE